MNSNIETIFLFAVTLTVALLGVYAISHLKNWEDAYYEGWRDCEEAHKKLGVTKDDEAVLKHLKSALKAYITAKGYKRRGDIKKLAKTENFEDFRHFVWNTCVNREDIK